MLCVQQYDSPGNYIINEGAAQVQMVVGVPTRLPVKPRQAGGRRCLVRGAWSPQHPHVPQPRGPGRAGSPGPEALGIRDGRGLDRG